MRKKRLQLSLFYFNNNQSKNDTIRALGLIKLDKGLNSLYL